MGGARVLQPSQPNPFVLLVKVFQAVQENRIKRKMAADLVNRFAMRIKGKESLYQVFQGELAVRDDEVREDGVGMAAAAYHTHDTDPRTTRLPIPKIKDIAVIVSMDSAVAPAFTAGTNFHLRVKTFHIFLEPIF